MYVDLLFILLPLVIGYLFVVKSEQLLHRVNQSCGYMVYFILFLMGISLSLIDNFASNAKEVVIQAVTFIGVILGVNLIGLYALDRWHRQKINKVTKVVIDKWPMIIESISLLGVVALGFVIGLFVVIDKTWIDKSSEWALMLLLLLIGISLRNSGIALRDILLNKSGMQIALVVMVTSWIGGLVVAKLLQLPLNHGLAVSSGFGWYSLSGILISDGISPLLGAVALINDLGRELVAIFIIPLLIASKRHSAIGIGGATSMDFTLPIIQKTGGSAAVPIAIVSGFILSIMAPLCMLFFINL
ncbi:lysine exporter LysO family protein [Psychrobium sp. MM17-31]|uniref:lysine exporter LysO family protein n=1 Tax=Psychrobium sp. MM17-31 TaxID=2917758 RepID=UPI001EF674A0|nr:lysine exporter LysO family protein [Psychrobium sp. MM17-31]MCG7529768.1 lysine exporter LysO family protein [Psychrobium sp. MM17-31]